MADFGVSATQLSAPTGAGANPIAPVTEVAVNTSNVSLFSAAAELFTQGLGDVKKERAQKAKSAVLGQYASERQKINDAVVSGQMDPIKAAAFTRRLNTKYLAGYADYADDLDKLHKSFQGLTEAGEIEDTIKSTKALRDADKEEARKRGATFLPGMSPQAEDAIIRATKTSIMAEREYDELIKRNVENRSQGEYDNRIRERELKDTSTRLLTNIAGTHLEAFQQFGATLVDQFKSGKVSPDQAKMLFQQERSRLNGFITTAASSNPELINPYKSLFDEVGNTYEKMFDPASQATQLEDQVKIILNKGKLSALADPRVRTGVVMSQLMGANAEIALASAQPIVNHIAQMINNPPDGPVAVPQIVGNPDVEKDVLTFFDASLKKLETGAYGDNNKAKQEAQVGVNNILHQVGGMLDQGTKSPIKLNEVAKFMASPAFGVAASKGTFDSEAMDAAKKVFQLTYEQTILKGVQQKMDKVFVSDFGSTPAPGSNTPKVKEKSRKVQELVDIKFTGAGIAFTPKEGAAKTTNDIRTQQEILTDLKQVQSAVTQLIKIGSHMSGTTDYSKYWNENRHVIFPNAGYPIPAKAPEKIMNTPTNQTELPSKNRSEADILKERVALTKGEQAASDAFEASDGNIQELQAEINRTDISATSKAILQQELNRLMSMRKK